MQYNNTQIIIMAGGVGSRFWPMSTPGRTHQNAFASKSFDR